MTHNYWIIDVLLDLRTFAEQNDLPLLAEQLDDARLVAASECASELDTSMAVKPEDAGKKARGLRRNLGTSDIA